MDDSNKYDFFISHASEDKDTYVRQLALLLENKGFTVWYDEYTLKIGDSLTKSINDGIKGSIYGLIILSKNFFKKQWTEKELNAFLSKEIIFENNLLLPIWLDVTKEEVFNFSPLIADKFAFKATSGNIPSLIDELSKRVVPRITNGEIIKERINFLLTCDDLKRKREEIDIIDRIERIFAYQNECENIIDGVDFEEGQDGYTAEQDYLFMIKEEELRKEYKLPKALWTVSEFFDPYLIESAKDFARQWINKAMIIEEAEEFLYLLDELLDTDTYYILYGLPYHTIKRREYYDLAKDGVIKIGTNADT